MSLAMCWTTTCDIVLAHFTSNDLLWSVTAVDSLHYNWAGCCPLFVVWELALTVLRLLVVVI